MFFIPLLFTSILFNASGDAQCRTIPVPPPVETILPLLIYFTSDDCKTCDEFDALFERAEILQHLEKKYVPVKVSIDDLEGRVCADIYAVTYIPAFVIADQKGVILYKSNETLTLNEITRLLENIPDQLTDTRPDVDLVTSTKESLQEKGPTSIDKEPISVVPDSSYDISNDQSDKVERVTLSPEIPKAIAVNNMHDVTQLPGEKNQKNIHPDKPLISIDNNNVSKTTPASPPLNKTTSPSNSISAKSPAATTSRTYAIQLGYFTEESNASKLVQKAKEKGLAEVRTQTETRNGVTYFRVLIGRSQSLSEAQKLLDEVHRVGLKGAVYRQ